VKTSDLIESSMVFFTFFGKSQFTAPIKRAVLYTITPVCMGEGGGMGGGGGRRKKGRKGASRQPQACPWRTRRTTRSPNGA
jgi:hypothetical protein